MSYSSVTTTSQADVRLRGMFTQIYAWMTAGLLVTGAVASFVANSPSMLRFIQGNLFVFFGLFIVQLVLVISLSAAIMRMSTAAATGLFLLYAAVNGLTLSGIFVYYTQESIALAFFVTAGMFAVTSLFGYITKRDLSAVGSIAFMALIGILLASLVNIFLRSTALYWIITYAGVLIFVGLTANDTQKLKRMATQAGEANAGRLSILGALILYLDFLNLFLFLLRIFGRRN